MFRIYFFQNKEKKTKRKYFLRNISLRSGTCFFFLLFLRTLLMLNKFSTLTLQITFIIRKTMFKPGQNVQHISTCPKIFAHLS